MSRDYLEHLADWGEPTPATKGVWRQAEVDLLIPVDASRTDPSLWEQAARVTCLALGISRLPETAGLKIDGVALVAATLYHDAGWAVQTRRKEISRTDIGSRPTSDAQRELAASLLETHGVKLLSDSTLRIAVRAVREWGQRATRQPEAQVVAEAHNLDQVGPQAILGTLRRHVAEARGVEVALDTWHRQQEYHYWEARLREGFRFETTRQLARQRLLAVERFMADLRRTHRLEDAAEHFAQQQASSGRPVG